MPARSRASTSGTRSNLYSLPQILDGELSREDGSDGKSGPMTAHSSSVMSGFGMEQ
jgi:hypothetical protein